jgi:hypothetical protein
MRQVELFKIEKSCEATPTAVAIKIIFSEALGNKKKLTGEIH